MAATTSEEGKAETCEAADVRGSPSAADQVEPEGEEAPSEVSQEADATPASEAASEVESDACSKG